MICKKERKKSLFLMICTQTSCVMIYHYSVMDKKSRIKIIRLFWWAGDRDLGLRRREVANLGKTTVQRQAKCASLLVRTAEEGQQFSYTPFNHTKKAPAKGCCFSWWAGVDSNRRSRRRQIYSLIHLATLEPAHVFLSVGVVELVIGLEPTTC